MTRRPLALGVLSTLTTLGIATTASAQIFSLEGRLTHGVGDEPYGVATADFDKNGRLDLAVVNGSSSTVTVLLRVADGGFAEEPGSPVAVSAGPNYGAVADFNGDTRPDLAIAGYVGNGISILLRGPAGGFVLEGAAPTAAQAVAPVVADFNGDTRPDVAVATPNGVAVFLRNVGGGFAQETTPSGLAAARFAVTADFNKDGRPDLALVNGTNDAIGTVTILLRTASGFAAEGAPITVGKGPITAAVTDLDNDGLPDLVVTNYGDNTLSVLLRTASGFRAEEGGPVAVGTGPVGVVAADFNLDGRPDLAVANSTAGTLTILQRDAVRGFVALPAVTNLAGIYGLAVGDFDGDQKPDLALTQLTTKTTSVLFNRYVPPGDAGADASSPVGDGGGGGPAGGGTSSGGAPPANATPATAPASDDGCGCRQVGTTSASGFALLAPLAILGLLWRRRRSTTADD
jgi:MYXO-CTERM domain-containing protein